MYNQQDPLFNVTHSLPVLAHSLAVANRTPSAGYQQTSKIMPEYGGVMETPTSCIKNSALLKGIHFRLDPFRFKINSDRPLSSSYIDYPKSNDCLLLSTYLSSHRNNEFSTLRAFKNDLLIDSVCETFNHSNDSYSYESINYVRHSFTNTITGIKITPKAPERLLVKSEEVIQAIRLNESYRLQEGTDTLGGPFKSISSFTESQHHTARDACWNPFNEAFLALASDKGCEHALSLYDVTRDKKKPFQKILWTDSSDIYSGTFTSRHIKRSMSKIYTPGQTSRIAMQQIDNVPSHLVNMLVTTSHRTALVDPRANCLGQVYVDKIKWPSFYPIEYLKRTEFSAQNSYQFYSLSNVHLRAFDTRFPGVPVNQLNHMLDSESFEMMNMRVVKHHRNNLETVCSSTPDRLCFITFDQSQQTSLVNPKSLHLPFHDLNQTTSENEKSEEYSGLAVTTSKDGATNELFTIYQLAKQGDINVKKFFEATSDCDMIVEPDQPVRMMVEVSRARFSSKPEFSRLDNPSIVESECSTSTIETINDGIGPLDLLETDEFARHLKKFDSRRVHERAQKLKDQLDSV